VSIDKSRSVSGEKPASGFFIRFFRLAFRSQAGPAGKTASEDLTPVFPDAYLSEKDDEIYRT
jgi:hypothetical protein